MPEQRRQSAFRSAARYYDNRRNKTKETQPDWKVLMDFTAEDAVKAAEWFMAMADDCQVNHTKIRKYDKEGNYEEVTGFTTNIGFWQKDLREGDQRNDDGSAMYPKFGGWFSPQPPAVITAQAEEPACPMPEPQQEQCPMPQPPAPANQGWGQPAAAPEKQPVAAGWN